MSLENDEDEETPKLIRVKDPEESKRLSDADYRIIVDAYERGTESLTDLANRFKITRQALYYRFQRDGVVRGSKTAVVEAEREVERFMEKRANWIEETRMEGFKALKQVQMIARKVVLDQVKTPGAKIGDVDVDLRAIGRLNKILCDNITTSLNILDADKHIDNKDLPMLVVEDLTDEEILEHHKSTGAMEMDATLEDLLAESLAEDDD